MHPFEASLLAAWPADQWCDETVVVGVSGGPDSVALWLALRNLRPAPARLHAAHFHHGSRGREADLDASFVQQLAQTHGCACWIGRAQHDLSAQGDGFEAAARAARYDFLERTAGDVGARYVAVAHTADDQAETVLHHVLRGSGLSGVCGMHFARPLGPAALVRPLLALRREDVLRYLAARGQTFREDASNGDLRHTRNKLRCELIPRLEQEYNPHVVEAIVRLSRLAQDAQLALRPLVESLRQSCVLQASRAEVRLRADRLAHAPRHLVRELLLHVWREHQWRLQGLGYEDLEQLAQFACEAQPNGHAVRRVFPGAVVAERHGDLLWLSCTADA